MSADAPRAGILVTGTEVLTGVISDRNGPWLSQRLRDLGVDAAMIEIVGDRPEDLTDALEHMRADGMTLIVTSGGLGPTADDLTAEIVGRFCGREMYLDEALSARIDAIVTPMLARWRNVDPEAVRLANVKQATVPRGATVLDPIGTAPGLVVPPADGGSGPTVVVLPGPPGELRPMWEMAAATAPFRAAIAGAPTYRTAVMRLFGMPESEIAESLRSAETDGLPLESLEITTCLRRGEIEIGTRFHADAQPDYDRLVAYLAERHGDLLFSPDGSTIDEQVATRLQGRTIAVAESCTAGLLAARLTDRAGSSGYFLGGAVVYSNAAKTDLAGVDPALIERVGAVSTEVAEALASGIALRFDASVGVGITGIAGPGGGTAEKPVGTVCISVWRRDRRSGDTGTFETRRMRLAGGRTDVRDRSVTVAMHLLRQALNGDGGG
jgi:competence/damage-inducible protein CinA-like protein